MSVPIMDKDVYKGQDKDFGIFVAKPDGMFNLTSSQLLFNVRSVVSGTPVITKDSDEVGEITLSDQGSSPGEAILTLEDTDTSLLESGRYYYDLWLVDPAGKKDPILTGYFWILDVAPSVLNTVRHMLDEAGELRIDSEQDEFLAPASLSVIYVPRQRIKEVEGVWLDTDTSHTGTNFYTGGGFDPISGKIWLGTELSTTNNYVRVNYSWESGVGDNTIYQHLHNSRMFVINYTGISFRYGEATTNSEQGAEAMAIAASIMACVLTVNGANVAQMGYNFRLDEFEIQSKLWGEGMIAEALFKQYRMEFEKWIQALGRKGEVYIANRDLATRKYNINTLIGYTNSVYEGAEGF